MQTTYSLWSTNHCQVNTSLAKFTLPFDTQEDVENWRGIPTLKVSDVARA